MISKSNLSSPYSARNEDCFPYLVDGPNRLNQSRSMMAEPASLGLAVLILVVGARSAPIPFLELSFHCNWRQDLEASESPERRVENQENRSSILEKKSSPIIITATHHVRRPEYIRPSVVGSRLSPQNLVRSSSDPDFSLFDTFSLFSLLPTNEYAK